MPWKWQLSCHGENTMAISMINAGPCGAMRGYAGLCGACGAMRGCAGVCGAMRGRGHDVIVNAAMRRYAAPHMRRYAALCGAMRPYAALCGPVKIHAPLLPAMGYIHYKWPFSIAMLVYQKVCWSVSTLWCIKPLGWNHVTLIKLPNWSCSKDVKAPTVPKNHRKKLPYFKW